MESKLGWDRSEALKGMIDNERVKRKVDWQSQLRLRNLSKMKPEAI